MGKFRAYLCFISLIHTTWWDNVRYEILFPVDCILRIWLYFSLGCRFWHRNLRLMIEKWTFRNFQGWPKKDNMGILCHSVSNIHWRSTHVKCMQILNVLDTTARHDLLRIREAQYGQSVTFISKSATLHVHLIVLSTFLCHHCTTTKWKCLTSRFIEDVNKWRRTFFLYEFAYIWQNKRLVIIAKKNERMWIYFLLKSDVFTATAVASWYLDLGALTLGGKNTSGHRTRPFGSRCLKFLIYITLWASTELKLWSIGGKFNQQSNKFGFSMV